MKTKYLAGSVALFSALYLLTTLPAHAAGRQLLHGHVPPAVSSLQPLGRLAATNRLQLAIGLPLRNQDALSNLLFQLYDPASRDFHKYVTPQIFARSFGPKEADYQALIDFARSNHFRVTATHPNRVLLDVDATVTDVERAFHLKMYTYRHPTENRTFYAPDIEPSLDLNVSVLHISGLNNFSLPRPRLSSVTAINQQYYQSTAPNAGAGPSGTYMGNDFRAAYAPGVSLNGSGQSVGLLQFDGYAASDITYYESHAGLPSVTLSNVLIDGATGLPSGTGGEVEVSLDIEMCISMAPGLSKIYLYEAPNPSPFVDVLNRMATDNLAKQLSCSWYQPNGPSNAVADQIFLQMAAQGQSFFSASGDNDAYTGLIPFPGDSPYVTEVGGTTLTSTGPAGSRVSETAWNRGSGIGTGGGISTQYPIPSWQTNINMVPIQGSSTMRNIPDVALTAENVYVRADGADHTVGGTSCAAPLWAGFAALINQQAASLGSPTVGFLNPAVYAIGAQANYPLIFHDTTNGNNTSTSSPARFYTAPGYDLCTGWGTPTGQALINALMAPIIITLPASATEGAGLLVGAGQIELPSALGTNVIVALASSDPSQVTVPATATILAGQTNATFDLTILDDGILDGTQIAAITASVPGIGNASASITIFDKESATLQVLLPASVTKGQGTVSGTVQVSAPVGANVSVTLSSSANNLMQVPASIVIPTGQTSAAFTATVLTDGQINGGQTVNVTAHVQNWTDGVAPVSVQDNVNLSVSLPASTLENVGVLTNAGSVSLAGTPVSNIVVTLVSSNPSKLIVPANITIFAGSLSNTFNVTPVDDPQIQNQTVTVTASASGFNNGSASMIVLDKDSPPVPSNPRPANLATNVPANTNLMWNNGPASINQSVLNGGFETGTFTNWFKTNSTSLGDWAIDNSTYIPPGSGGHVTPFAGSFCALSEQTGGGIHTLYQDIAIPIGANSATLSWADCIRNFGTQYTTNTQYFHVEIRRTNNALLQLAFTTAPGSPLTNNWTTRSIDLSAYVGQTVRIAFVESDTLGYFNVGLDNVSLQVNAATNSAGAITNDVYFGTDPLPGPADYQGTTTNTSWTLPQLAPLTTYYWQIIAHRIGSTTGAVWQFTTAGVDHFAWSNITSPQLVNQPFGVTISAQDAFNTTVTNFTGPVNLSATSGSVPGLLFGDDFESGNFSSWSIGTDNVIRAVTNNTAASGNDSFTIIGGVNDHYEGIWHTLSNLTPARVSFSVRASATNEAGGYFVLANATNGATTTTGNTAVFFFMQPNGTMGLSQSTVTAPYVANQWYQISLMFNWTNKTVDYYVNSALVQAAIPFRATSVNNLSIVHLYNYNSTQAWWDNIQFSGGNLPAPLSISPASSGVFANGVWSGNITVQAPATNAVLRADDGNGHIGTSNPFAVDLTNDISINVAAFPSPVSVGANLTYTLTVGNTGPTDGTGVVVTNLLPANASFVSAVSSQGTCSQNNGMVIANLGVVPGGANAAITIVVTPTIAGVTLTNIATVTRAEADAYLGNNVATNLTQVTTPAISIADGSCLEGNVGTTNLLFNVTLAVPSAQTITVNYATANGTAVAGKDYVATNGVLSFAPGTTNQTIAVAVIGNTLVESNKTLLVNLSSPINGTLARSQAMGTIINDDGLPGQIDHFSWGVVPSLQLVSQPFAVMIAALDYSNNVATNFNGTAEFTASTGLGTNALVLPVAPAVSGPFTNGIWSGPISVLTPATNVVLTADDANGHTNASNPFDVDLTNDLFINIVASPNPAALGSNLTYTLTIANTGPSDATAVMLTNTIPAVATFVSVTSSQGTCSQSGGLVTGNLGVVPGGTNATVTIVVVPTTPGTTLTNIGTVSRAEADAYLGNNTATNVVAVAPAVSVADSSCVEGNVSTTNMLFSVTLNVPFFQTSSVYYATADGIAVAGKDYVSTNGLLTFAPGVTNQTIAVAVIGNTIIEPNKTFFVNLSSPTNATLGRAQAVGTIINDDGLPGQLDHFAWSVISSPQLVGTPFVVTINALDASNNPATNFNGLAILSGAGDHGPTSLAPTNVGPFTLGQWVGTLTVNTLDTNIVLTASDANGHTNSSNPFYMIGVGSTFIPAANRVDMVEDSLRDILYITAGNQVLRYSLNSGTFLTPFTFGTSLNGIDISPDNNTLVVADTSAYNSSNVWVYAVDLPSGTNRQITFPAAFYEGGTYAVAFGYDGAAIVSSTFLGSGWVPLRRVDPVSGNYTVVGNPRQDSMVSSSGDRRIVGIAEANISSGPLDRYDVASQTITGSVGDGWFNFECAVNRDGSQFAVPTYDGTFIYDTNLNQIGLLGTYASEGPIGGAYDPQADLAFFAWWPTSFLRAYETHTMAPVASYDCGYNFGWTGNGAFGQGRVRISPDGNNLFVTVGNGVQWISRPVFPPADLALSLSGSPSTGNAGSNLTYTITVSNAGPNTVTDARVFDRLPSSIAFVSATSPQGPCVLSNGLVTCTLTPLTNGGNATVTIVVTPPVEAVLTNTAAIYSSATDTNPANNFAVLLTTVHGVASLSVTPASGLASSGTTGGPFNPSSTTYTLTNNGTGSLNWSAGYSSDWITLSAASGTLAPGAAATVTVSISSAANSLPAGSYSDSVTFTNVTNGNGNTARGVSLTVIPVGILNVTPTAGFASFGPRGGPFLPANQVYVLTNIGDGSLTWTVNNTNLSFDLSATSGVLAPGTATNVVVSVDNSATNLPRGIYTSLIGFTNLSNGRGNAAYTASLTVNTAPVALPQTVTLPENGSLVITLKGTDADNDPLTAYITALPANGVLSQTLDGITAGAPITSVPNVVSNASGKVIFSLPQNGYGNGFGNFQFKVNDGIADSSNALVTVNVTHVNHPPVAANDTVAFILGTPQISFNVLNNDSDPDNDPLTVQSFTLPTRGTLTQVTNGLFTYQPNLGFTNGQDQFNYTISDGQGGSASAQVTIKAYTQYLNGGDWPTFGNGPSHTAYYPAMLGGLSLVPGWSTNFGIALNQVATGAGNVYVTPITYFSASNLIALNAASGQPVWQQGFPSVFSINPPTFDNGRLYVQVGQGLGGGSPLLWSFNATNGSVLWSSSFGAQWERYFAPTVVSNGIWVDGGYYGGLYGFNTNGSEMFFYNGLQQYDEWTPTYYQGTIYTWVAGEFRAHDPTTGNVLWMANFNWNWAGWSMNTASAIDGGRAFVEQPPNLIAIDLTRHTNAWISSNNVVGSPAVANGIVYVISGDGVQSLSAQNGQPLGFYEATNDTGLAWQPIVTDDTLFVSSSSATYVFDLSSRSLLQTIPYGGPLSIANGRLYLAGQDGWLRTYTVLDTNRPPVILIHPLSQTVLGGSNVTFAVSAVGSSPLGYSWQKNNSALSGANGSSLLLTNVVRTNSGSYNVIITNSAGVAISSNAVLVVHVPQLLSNPVWQPDGTLLLTSSDLGGGSISAGNLASFTAQSSSNLLNWTDLPGALTVTNGALQLHDVGVSNSPTQFYRIIEKW